MEISLLEAGSYALDRLALTLIIGCCACAGWVMVEREGQRLAAKALRQMVDLSLALLLVTTPLILLWRTATLADVPLSGTAPYLLEVIGASAFGTLWLTRLSATLFMVAMWGFGRRSLNRRSALLLGGGAAVIAFSLSGASHAGDEGPFTFANLNNTLHIIAAAVWGGAIITYLPLIKRMEALGGEFAASSAARLSAVAGGALTLVAVSGIINVWQRFDTLEQLWSSAYGITLLIKLSFVAAMITIGAYNRFRAVPALIRSPSENIRPLHNTLRLDAVLVAAVITLAAVLAMQSPSH